MGRDPIKAAVRRKRWKQANADKVYAATHKAYKATAFRSRRPWTDHEDERVLAHDKPDMALVEEIDRSLGAIHVRRSRLLATQEERKQA